MGFLNDSEDPFTVRKASKHQKTWVSYLPSKPMVAGSNPAGIANDFKYLD